MSKNDVLRVEIRASQVVHFKQIVNMTRKEWNEIKNQEGQDMLDQHKSAIDGWIDKRDVYDGGDFESVSASVVDENGKPVESEEQLKVS